LAYFLGHTLIDYLSSSGSLKGPRLDPEIAHLYGGETEAMQIGGSP